MGAIKELLDVMLHPATWLGDRANRVRLFGGRVQIIALVLTRDPEAMVLLGKSPYHDMWMPPQEGVNLNEKFPQALRRCLEVECGLSLPPGDLDYSKLIHVRSTRYMGAIDLPPERHGERPVADDVLGTPLEHVKLKKKAYWVATVIVKSTSDISPIPDGKELKELKWFSLSEARDVIVRTNHRPKANLLLRCLDQAKRDLYGANREAMIASSPAGPL